MFCEKKMIELCEKYGIELKNKEDCTKNEIANLSITREIFDEPYTEIQPLDVCIQINSNINNYNNFVLKQSKKDFCEVEVAYTTNDNTYFHYTNTIQNIKQGIKIA